MRFWVTDEHGKLFGVRQSYKGVGGKPSGRFCKRLQQPLKYTVQMVRGLILAGLVLVLLGATLSVFPKAFSWFGQLPGDVRTDHVFFPVTSMLLISGVLTVIVNVLAWVLRR